MPKLSPISQKSLVKKFKLFGFDGPYQQGKHPYMIKGSLSITVPNPHETIVSVDLLTRILRQAGITRAQWMSKK